MHTSRVATFLFLRCYSSPIHSLDDAQSDMHHRCQRGGRVVGVASTDNHLFVLRSPSQQRIQVYDLQTFTLQPKTIKVSGLSDEHRCNGLTACDINKCLYVSDFSSAAVHQMRLTDIKIRKWSVGRGPCGLSVNTECNLLVACYEDNKIQEYTKEGSFVREICIQCNDGKSLLYPHHAVQ